MTKVDVGKQRWEVAGNRFVDGWSLPITVSGEIKPLQHTLLGAKSCSRSAPVRATFRLGVQMQDHEEYLRPSSVPSMDTMAKRLWAPFCAFVFEYGH